MAETAAASSGAGAHAPHAGHAERWPLGGLAGDKPLRLGRPSRASDLLPAASALVRSLDTGLRALEALTEAVTSTGAWASDCASWRTTDPGQDLTEDGLTLVVKAAPVLVCTPVLSVTGGNTTSFVQEMMRQALLVRIENSESIRRT